MDPEAEKDLRTLIATPPSGPLLTFPRRDWSTQQNISEIPQTAAYSVCKSTEILWSARGASEQWYYVASAREQVGDIATRRCLAAVARDVIAIATCSEPHMDMSDDLGDLTVALAPMKVPLRNLVRHAYQPVDFTAPPATTITESIFILAIVDKIIELEEIRLTYARSLHTYDEWPLFDYQSLEQWQEYTQRLIPLVYQLAIAALPSSISCPTLLNVRSTIRVILDNVCEYQYWLDGWKNKRPPPFNLSFSEQSLPVFPRRTTLDKLVPVTAPPADGILSSAGEPLMVRRAIREEVIDVDDTPDHVSHQPPFLIDPVAELDQEKLRVFLAAYSTTGVVGSRKKRPKLRRDRNGRDRDREWEAEESLRIKMYQLRVRSN